MEVLVILAGLYNNVNVLAAQVILVAFGQLLIMIPYGLSLATVTTVGNSLGANRPFEAIANCRMIAWITTGATLFVVFIMINIKRPLIELYASGESTDVIEIAHESYIIFLTAFVFDATQCNASGVIKATG